MTRWLAASIGRAVERNDIDLVIARDMKEPFRDETRKAKRNLIAAGFAAIVIAALDVKVNSFIGLSAGGGVLAADITRGLACLAVIYFLAGYVIDAILDYSAWSIEIKRLRVTPYLALVNAVERTFRASAQQLEYVAWTFDHLSKLSESVRTGSISTKNFTDALGKLPVMEQNQREVMEEIRPLLAKWKATLRSLSFQVGGRRAARAVRMWGWDFAVPLAVAGVAVSRTYDGLWAVIPKLLGLS